MLGNYKLSQKIHGQTAFKSNFYLKSLKFSHFCHFYRKIRVLPFTRGQKKNDSLESAIKASTEGLDSLLDLTDSFTDNLAEIALKNCNSDFLHERIIKIKELMDSKNGMFISRSKNKELRLKQDITETNLLGTFVISLRSSFFAGISRRHTFNCIFPDDENSSDTENEEFFPTEINAENLTE